MVKTSFLIREMHTKQAEQCG